MEDVLIKMFTILQNSIGAFIRKHLKSIAKTGESRKIKI